MISGSKNIGLVLYMWTWISSAIFRVKKNDEVLEYSWKSAIVIMSAMLMGKGCIL